jgi:hypothetical protein
LRVNVSLTSLPDVALSVSSSKEKISSPFTPVGGLLELGPFSSTVNEGFAARAGAVLSATEPARMARWRRGRTWSWRKKEVGNGKDLTWI